MFFEIRHETNYHYSAPVQLGRQLLRFRPLSNANQHLHSFAVNVDPQPAGRSEIADLDSNTSLAVWFDGYDTQHLQIEVTATVETLRANPFDYLWQGDHMLPMTYPHAFQDALEPFMATLAAASVRALSAEVADAAGGGAQDYLPLLARTLHQRLERKVRPQGAPLAPEETLKRGEGSCRDLTVLFLAAARLQGFAGRFVSGYHCEPSGDGSHDLHAWPEIYLPGGGWRGFDPSTGLAVSNRHIAIAVGARPEQAAPVSGTYAGTATSRLETLVTITPLKAVA